MQTMERQVIGAVLIVLLMNILYLSKTMWGGTESTVFPLFSKQNRGYNAVELRGSADIEGVYFVPPRTSLKGLLDQLTPGARRGLPDMVLNRELQSGDVVSIPDTGGTDSGLTVARHAMSNARRHALDMPMDVNSVGLNELMMVPGIGERTAKAILEKREELKGFSWIEDITQVRGIGEKKLERFRKYLCVVKNTPQ